MYKVYPHRTVGVLFFSQGGYDYRCSASSIGNYAVWTAGHCVSDGGGNWSTNFLFIPAYKDGNPVVWWAQYTGANAWVFTDWHYNGEWCRDSGGVVLNVGGNGQPVSIVGWLGFAWNWPRDQHWHEMGYPAAPPFDGNRLQICASSRNCDDECIFADNPPTQSAGCDQTPGCSGGPWIKDHSWNAGATNYLNGNFSYYYIGFEEEIYSPYFDDLSYGLWDALVNDVP
jgi:V8-like Glu-specific endopeptidase